MKLRSDPDYRANQRAAQRAWSARNEEYWRDRRQSRPAVAHGKRAPLAFDGNPKAQQALGLSARELEVLHELAAGRSNKEIAALPRFAEHDQDARGAAVREAGREAAHRGDPPRARAGDRALTPYYLW